MGIAECTETNGTQSHYYSVLQNGALPLIRDETAVHQTVYSKLCQSSIGKAVVLLAKSGANIAH